MNRALSLVGLLGVSCLFCFASPVVAIEVNLDPAATSGVVTLPNGQEVGFTRQGAPVVLANGSDYLWWYGCSPTSAGMMLGYYDRNGYQGVQYSNLVQGGVAEATTGPLARATIASSRHVSDFYGGADAAGAPTGSWDCLADYMGTSQDGRGGADGSTNFWFFTDGSPLYVKDAYSLGISNNDGTFGIFDYIENYAGYNLGDPSTSTAAFTQLIYSESAPNGFTWDDYKAEIDAGRPVMIQVSGHSMCGYGYDDSTQGIILHNTWWNGAETMTWGGEYYGMQQWGVVCLTLPEPSTVVLLGLGALAGAVVALCRRRR
jgi:hypothetical protein